MSRSSILESAESAGLSSCIKLFIGLPELVSPWPPPAMTYFNIAGRSIIGSPPKKS
jgi:hypothetical protein